MAQSVSLKVTPMNYNNRSNTNTRPKTSPVGALTALVDLRRDVSDILDRIDAVLVGLDGSHGSNNSATKGRQIPSTQSYPPGYDFRTFPEGLGQGLSVLYDRVALVDTNVESFEYDEDLYNEICLRAAEARLYQHQAREGSREWETAVGVIRTLTRIVSEQRPGFVYGLASNHNTDWGKKIEEIRSKYTPTDIG